MDYNLTTEEELIKKVAKEFSESVIAPLQEEIHANNEVPGEVLEGMAELGLFGINAPEDLGGGGASFVSFVSAIEEIAVVSAGVGMIMSVNNMGHTLINFLGNDEQRKKYIPKLVAGEELASFAFTEPSTGSDPKQLQVTAVEDGDFFVLNGTKRFITNSNLKGPMIIVAKEESSSPMSGKATAFVIDKHCEGYSLSEPWDKVGVHGGPLFDVYLKDVRIPKENMLGDSGNGMYVLKMTMVFAKVGVCGICLGVARAAYEEAVAYAKEKTHRGEAIIKKFEHVRMALTEMEMIYNRAKWVTYHYAWALDGNIGDPFVLAKLAAQAKVEASEAAVDIVRKAMGVLGSYGCVSDYKLSRLWGDAIVGPQVEGCAATLKVMAGNISYLA
ncbi:MAG: acyl-CoA dehydrogenase family protein [Coriobacteriales bacterium]|jgi:alkylation response protein AidB-like acyl-CoA dehydrogenase|nr:acyl-CoA dehydrogenase family protein [Coriobacteriales bacterium]